MIINHYKSISFQNIIQKQKEKINKLIKENELLKNNKAKASNLLEQAINGLNNECNLYKKKCQNKFKILMKQKQEYYIKQINMLKTQINQLQYRNHQFLIQLHKTQLNRNM